MGRLLAGIGLFVFGIALASEPGGELPGLFALLTGVVMVIGGVRRLSQKRSMETELGQLAVKHEDLWQRLLADGTSGQLTCPQVSDSR